MENLGEGTRREQVEAQRSGVLDEPASERARRHAGKALGRDDEGEHAACAQAAESTQEHGQPQVRHAGEGGTQSLSKVLCEPAVLLADELEADERWVAHGDRKSVV